MATYTQKHLHSAGSDAYQFNRAYSDPPTYPATCLSTYTPALLFFRCNKYCSRQIYIHTLVCTCMCLLFVLCMYVVRMFVFMYVFMYASMEVCNPTPKPEVNQHISQPATAMGSARRSRNPPPSHHALQSWQRECSRP